MQRRTWAIGAIRFLIVSLPVLLLGARPAAAGPPPRCADPPTPGCCQSHSPPLPESCTSETASPFDRSNWSGKGIGVQTRVLDDLAAHSAVFPRAHLAGIACTASRHTFMLGRHQRHLNYLLAGGSGALECQSGPPKGCSSNSDCT